MVKLLARRFGEGSLSLILLFTFVFFAIRIVPGDPATLLAGPSASPEDVNHLRESLGLNGPLWQQYLVFIGQVVHGSLGKSVTTGVPVAEEISRRFPLTLELALAGMALATALGMVGGLISAAHRNSAGDASITAAGIALTSIPAFWLAVLLVDLFSIRLGWLPSSGVGSPAHLLLPSGVLAATQVGLILRVTRSSVLDAASANYVRTARAKGLHPLTIWLVHILRNALIPTITMVGLQFGLLFGGTVVTETVFDWPGVGQLLVSAVANHDYPVIQALILLFGIVFIIVNLVVDAVNSLVDPKVRLA